MDYIKGEKMNKIKLNKDVLLGGILLDKDKYQVVHMNLKKGNQTDDYSNDRNILLFNISGKITVALEDTVIELNDFELLEIERDTTHIITCLDDAQIIAIKI